MVCPSCGVKNVEFATTCYSCTASLGRAAGNTTPAARDLDVTITADGHSARPLARVPGVVTLARLAIVIAVVWMFARLAPAINDAVRSHDTSEEAEQRPPPPASEPRPPAVEEQNGLRLTVFEWTVPSGRAEARYYTGETVRGRSEIQGFGVTPDRRIDVTMTLAFRDPMGALVEPIVPSVLRQPLESPTLFTNFDYAILLEAPAGDYDLEIAVDDAVSGRSARFHRKIPVEPAPPAGATES